MWSKGSSIKAYGEKLKAKADAYDAAEAWTFRADASRLHAVEAHIMALCDGTPLVLIGVSNGAIPAAALAIPLQASAVWLASGVASQATQDSAAAGWLPYIPMIVTAASKESTLQEFRKQSLLCIFVGIES